MAAWLQLNVLVILGADLAQLEGRTHLTVEFILLLGHSDVVFCDIRDETRQVGVCVLSIRIQVAAAIHAHHHSDNEIHQLLILLSDCGSQWRLITMVACAKAVSLSIV